MVITQTVELKIKFLDSLLWICFSPHDSTFCADPKSLKLCPNRLSLRSTWLMAEIYEPFKSYLL